MSVLNEQGVLPLLVRSRTAPRVARASAKRWAFEAAKVLGSGLRVSGNHRVSLKRVSGSVHAE